MTFKMKGETVSRKRNPARAQRSSATTIVQNSVPAAVFSTIPVLVIKIRFAKQNEFILRLGASCLKVPCESQWTSWCCETDFRNGRRKHTVVRARNTHIQARNYCSRADSPDEPMWLSSAWMAVSKERRPNLLRYQFLPCHENYPCLSCVSHDRLSPPESDLGARRRRWW